MDWEQIKLLVWDLDETLWNGVLSEGEVYLPEENKQLIRDAVDAGVMCAICSKNDKGPVQKKLAAEGISELFVFNSINWSAKGTRVKQIINEMNLRPANVMFIDDNPSNRAEVEAICDGVTSEDVDVIPGLRAFFAERNTKDTTHSRLKQYQLLEKKRDYQVKLGSNQEFLKQSNIRVELKNACLEHLDRIYDLVCRSNQLNFTKVRSTKEELKSLFLDDRVCCGYVEVNDNFGDYGIVGFYAKKHNTLIHFTFSCRILGMGVEQYVYQVLDKPELIVEGEVASDLNCPSVDWINQNTDGAQNERIDIQKGKMLIKGPCDMQQMFAYMVENRNIVTEFVYVNDKGVSIEQGNHTAHIVQSRTLSDSDKDRLAKMLPFGDKDMFRTAVYDADVDYIVLSLFTDPNLGLYRENETGIVVAFGEYVNDLTDRSRWDQYIKKEVFVANCNFAREDLEAFSSRFSFIGRITVDQIILNLDDIYRHIGAHTHLILVLGSELEYSHNTKAAYADRHVYHQQLNLAVKKWRDGKNRVHLLDVNEIALSPADFTNNINHFTRKVYYQMSSKLVAIIESISGKRLKQNGEILANAVHFLRKLRKLPVKLKAFLKRG